MKAIRILALLGLGLSVSACAGIDSTMRNAPFELLPTDSQPATAVSATVDAPVPLTIAAEAAQEAAAGKTRLALVPGEAPVTVRKLSVMVPRSLKVSEANTYLPHADIVWRGDPIGDRYTQVQKIFETSMRQGVKSMHGPIPVDIEIKVTRFHALTEKARYSVGGVHNMEFDLSIRNPKTGELLVPVRSITADLKAFGGRQAIAADARGDTQKARITAFLAETIREELTNPEGYREAKLGFFQFLNHL
jgi:hypothetical protein